MRFISIPESAFSLIRFLLQIEFAQSSHYPPRHIQEENTMKNNLLASIAENTLIVVVFVLLIAVMFAAAKLAEGYVAKKTGEQNSVMTTRKSPRRKST